MMVIEVNKHKLPPLLVKLIADGKWGNRQFLPTSALNKMLAKAGLPCVNSEMEMNSLNIDRDWSKFGANPQNRLRLFEIYGLASSNESGQDIIDEGIIDIDQSIFIAGNYDEDVICLDYRENPANPCLRAYIVTNEFFIDWRMIAPDFETFARELGLVESENDVN